LFSYRHAYHAGNHADVFKHLALIEIMRHMTQKETALVVLDTHAGAGLYQLDSLQAKTSNEADFGYKKLIQSNTAWVAPIQQYIDLIASFNQAAQNPPLAYPGSPFIIQRFLRENDRLKLFEMHPNEIKILSANVDQLRAGRQIAALHEDGFAGIRQFLPPPARRGLVFCDPSYELKSDYAQVVDMLRDGLKRFATGTYAVWYPALDRPELAPMLKKIKAIAEQSGKSWLHAELNVKSPARSNASGASQSHGLCGSGLLVINPPFTLHAAIAPALVQLVQALGQDTGAGFNILSS
jgi:23S rRNA (adenine2030-N6)-methyltransferase